MKKKLNIKRILVIVSLALLFAPLTQSVFSTFEVKKLSGAFTLPDTVMLNSDTWHSGEFQNKYSSFYEYKIGFRSTFVRLRNQLAFSFFNKSTSYVTIGKDENLYSWGYLEAYKGLGTIHPEQIQDTVLYIEAIRQALHEKNIELLVIMAPNKVRVNESILTDEDALLKKNKSKYDYFLENIEQYPIHFIDFNKWFSSKDKRFAHPLFPSTGIHWSTYGAALASDTILKYIEEVTGKDLIDYKVSSFESKPQPRHSEVDLMNDLNLLYDFYPKNLVYPVVMYDSLNNINKYKPKVWVISDSFYWNIFGLDIQQNHFSPESEFWFYNNTAYGNGRYGVPTKSFDRIKALDKKEVVVLMGTESNLKLFPYGFIKMMKNELGLDDRVSKLRLELKKAALTKKVEIYYNSLSQMPSIISKYDLVSEKRNEILFERCRKAVVLEDYSTSKNVKIEAYKFKIKATENWYKSVIEKGAKMGKTEEEAIASDANYMYLIEGMKKVTDQYDGKYNQLIVLYEEIVKNKIYYEKIKQEAIDAQMLLEFQIVGHIDYLIYTKSLEANK